MCASVTETPRCLVGRVPHAPGHPSRTWLRVSWLTRGPWLNTRDIGVADTSASLDTSRMVTPIGLKQQVDSENSGGTRECPVRPRHRQWRGQNALIVPR